jgi:hypothetical protein
MKKLLLLSASSLLALVSFSQDLTGTWDGVFYDQRNPEKLQVFYIFLEIKQAGKAVWGVYDVTTAYNMNTEGCLCSVNAVLPNKSNSTVALYKDHVVNAQISGQMFSYCNYLSKLDARFIIQDSVEYLTGRWYGDRLGGSFVLQHVKPNTYRDVDTYFPNLKKMIAKGTKDLGKNTSQPVIIADTSKPTYDDQRLIDALKKARQEKTKG